MHELVDVGEIIGVQQCCILDIYYESLSSALLERSMATFSESCFFTEDGTRYRLCPFRTSSIVGGASLYTFLFGSFAHSGYMRTL